MPPSPRSSVREHLNVIDPDAGKRYKLHIRGAVHKLTVGKVKHCLATASSCPIPEARMVLKLNGVPLSNDRDVCGSLGILSGATLSVEAAPPSRFRTDPALDGSSSSRHVLEAPRGGASGYVDRHPTDPRTRRSGLLDRSQRSQPQSDGWDKDLNRREYKSAGTSSEGYDDNDEDDAVAPLVSLQRQMLEAQTLQEQEHFLKHDSQARDRALNSSLARLDDELDRAHAARRQLERQQQTAAAALKQLQEREAEAAKEKARLAKLQQEEEARAAERAADLAARRDQLRSEQEQVRRLAQLKLENEKARALVESQRRAREEERRRAAEAQRALEEEDKHRQLALRAREIDMEHQRLQYIRGQRALLEEKEQALEEKEAMYRRMGIEPSLEVQRERAMVEADKAAFATEVQRQQRLQQAPAFPALQDRDGARDGSLSTPLRLVAPPPPPPVDPAAYPRSSSAPLATQQNGTNPAAVIHNRNSNDDIRNGAPLVVPSVPDGTYYDPVENAAENLRRLGEDLELTEPLTFDEANTCVISIDGAYTLLVTYDAATERLFLYSTLLTAIPGGPQGEGSSPDAADFRLRLYEYLLEGSLLGRDMCGGGIGASLKNDFILMSTSLYMPTSQPWALRTVAPQFLQCLQHWRERVAQFMDDYQHKAQAAATTFPAVRGASHEVYRAASPNPGSGVGPSSALPMASQQPQQPQQRAGSLFFSKDDFLTQRPLDQDPQPQRAPPPLPQQHQPPHGGTAGYREVPVMGLEVTDTVMLDGVPTRYQEGGVLVVSTAGPAALAGLQPHDLLVSLDSARVRHVGDFQALASQLSAGQVVTLQVVRHGAPMSLRMQVGSVWVPA